MLFVWIVNKKWYKIKMFIKRIHFIWYHMNMIWWRQPFDFIAHGDVVVEWKLKRKIFWFDFARSCFFSLPSQLKYCWQIFYMRDVICASHKLLHKISIYFNFSIHAYQMGKTKYAYEIYVWFFFLPLFYFWWLIFFWLCLWWWLFRRSRSKRLKFVWIFMIIACHSFKKASNNHTSYQNDLTINVILC